MLRLSCSFLCKQQPKVKNGAALAMSLSACRWGLNSSSILQSPRLPGYLPLSPVFLSKNGLSTVPTAWSTGGDYLGCVGLRVSRPHKVCSSRLDHSPGHPSHCDKWVLGIPLPSSGYRQGRLPETRAPEELDKGMFSVMTYKMRSPTCHPFGMGCPP